MSDRETYKVEPKKVKAGDIMAFTYYAKVTSVHDGGERLVVGDLDNSGTPISITGKELIVNSFSADQYEKEETVGKMKAAEILINSPNRPLSVCFEKADGTERTMRGRLVKPEALLGRSMVEDLETTDKNRLRQVDHRTIKWLVVDGVKYNVK